MDNWPLGCLVGGVSVSLVTFLFLLFVNPKSGWEAMFTAVPAGLLGGACGLAYITWRNRSQKGLSREATVSIAARQSCAYRRIFTLACSEDEAVRRCTEAIQQIPGLESVTTRSGPNALTARKRAALSTWGDRIDFFLSPSENGVTIVDVISRPLAVGTIVDYGSNRATVEAIVKILGVNEQNFLLRPSEGAEESLLRPAENAGRQQTGALPRIVEPSTYEEDTPLEQR